MQNIELLLDSIFPFVEDLMKKYGEFYPVAAAISTSNQITTVGTYDGSEHPKSVDVISMLKAALHDKQENYLAITIFYDVAVTDNETGLKKDAIAVFAEIKEDDTAFIFYYPYILMPNKKMEYSNSWKTAVEKQVFI